MSEFLPLKIFSFVFFFRISCIKNTIVAGFYMPLPGMARCI